MEDDDEISIIYSSSDERGEAPRRIGHGRGTRLAEASASESDSSADRRTSHRGESRYRKKASSFDSDESQSPKQQMHDYKASFLPSTSADKRNRKKGSKLCFIRPAETPSSESSSSPDQPSAYYRLSKSEKYVSSYPASRVKKSRKSFTPIFLPSTSGYKGSRKKGEMPSKRYHRKGVETSCKFGEPSSSESHSSDMDSQIGYRNLAKLRNYVSSSESDESQSPRHRAGILRDCALSFLPSVSGYKSHHKKGTITLYQHEEATSSESDNSDTDQRIGYHDQGEMPPKWCLRTGTSDRPVEISSSESEEFSTDRHSRYRGEHRLRKYVSSFESDESPSPEKQAKLPDYKFSYLPAISGYKSKKIKVTLEETRFHFKKKQRKSNRRSILMIERSCDFGKSPESSIHPTKKRYHYDSSSTCKGSRKRQKMSSEDNVKYKEKSLKALKMSSEDNKVKYKEKPSKSLFPMRPGFGEEGRHISVVSNCYPIKFPSGYVYHYDIEIIQSNPRKAKYSEHKKYRCFNTKRNRKVVAFMLDHNPEFEGIYGAFDGRKNLLTKEELELNLPFTCTVMLPDKNTRKGFQNLKFDNYSVKIISLVAKINLDSIEDFYQKKCNDLPQEAIMALEIILRNDPCLKLTPIGRSFFYPPDYSSLTPFGGGLEIWFGYHQSIRLGQWKPTVNLDVSATMFRKAGPVLNYIADYMDMTVRDLQELRHLNKNDIRRMNRKLKQRQVRVTHLSYRRKYRIIRLRDFSANQEFIEFTDNGTKTRKSVAEYFKETYGKHLEYGNLPCLQVQPERRNIFMPIEVCEFTDGQHYKGELTPTQKSKMIKFTSISPNERFRKIQDIISTADFNTDKVVKGFGIEISDRPVVADARVLVSPNLVYKDRYNSEKTILPFDGSWDVRDAQFYQGAVISRWALLSFYRYPNLDMFADLLEETSRNLGLQLGELSDIMVLRDTNCDMKKMFEDLKEKGNQLVVIVIPKVVEREEKHIYAEIKKITETEVGLPTQCIKEETLRDMNGKRGPQVVISMCLKINAKLGGENHSLCERDMPSILFKPVIIIGADVNHPAVTQRNQPSIAACVGSLDCLGKRFGVSIRAQVHSKGKKKIEEIITLEDMVYELLLEFYKYTKRQRPEKIIFYRDGVSEGELKHVKNKEVVSIRRACQRLDEDYQPGITVIIVQKRHHIRFKPIDRRDGTGRKGNIPPGTVIETDVTHPVNFDFFLCSQLSPQGTSRPSHYLVLEDDNNFSADELQKLTFFMCHMYVRCTKSISIPAPVAYADLVAYRARRHLDSKKREELSSSNEYCKNYRLTQDDMNAIEVVRDLKNSMYFV